MINNYESYIIDINICIANINNNVVILKNFVHQVLHASNYNRNALKLH